MLIEERANIRTYCHTWAAAPIVEDDVMKGVIFESKEGRKAVLAKVVIDGTGDGDIFGYEEYKRATDRRNAGARDADAPEDSDSEGPSDDE